MGAVRGRSSLGRGFVLLAAISLLAWSLGSGAMVPADADSTAPSLVLSLRTNCGEVMADDPVEIRATLTADGIGIAGARLMVGVSQGDLQPPEDLGGGGYRFSWIAPFVIRPTYFPMWVRAYVDGYDNASARIVFLVDPHETNTLNPMQIFLYVRASSTSVRPGGTVDVLLYAYAIQGYLIAGATVRLLLSQGDAGTLSGAGVSGCGYAFTFTASPSITSVTGVLVTISASKVGYSSAVARLGLYVVP